MGNSKNPYYDSNSWDAIKKRRYVDNVLRMKRIDRRQTHPLVTYWMRYWYNVEGLSGLEIARRLHLSQGGCYAVLKTEVKIRNKDRPLLKPRALLLPEKDIDEIVRLYVEEQHSSKDIANQFHVAPSTIIKYLRNRKIDRRKAWQGITQVSKPTVLNEEEITAAYSDHLNGMTITDVAKKYFVTDSSIRKYFKQRGWRTIRRNPRGPSRTREYQELTARLAHLYFEEQLSTGEIAEQTGLTQKFVHSRLTYEGYELRSPSEAQLLTWKKQRRKPGPPPTPRKKHGDP